MTFSALPVAAAWQHHDVRLGFEVTYFQPVGQGYLINGCATAVEDGFQPRLLLEFVPNVVAKPCVKFQI